MWGGPPGIRRVHMEQLYESRISHPRQPPLRYPDQTSGVLPPPSYVVLPPVHEPSPPRHPHISFPPTPPPHPHHHSQSHQRPPLPPLSHLHPQQQQVQQQRQLGIRPLRVVVNNNASSSSSSFPPLNSFSVPPPFPSDRYIPFPSIPPPSHILPPIQKRMNPPSAVHERIRERQEIEATGIHAKPLLRKGCDPATLPSDSNYIRCSTLDSTLNVTLTEFGVQVTTDPHQVLLWGGSRANVGVTHGKWVFECRYMASHGGNKPEDFSVMRVGWSLEISDRIGLGDDDISFGFDSNGITSHAGVFTEFSQPFEVGDTVGCMIDLDDFTMSYALNGEFLGVAQTIPETLRGKAFFPHVNMRNGTARFNFHPPSIIENFPSSDTYKFIGVAPDDFTQNRPSEERPRNDCEVIFLVGLPSSGKTRWATQLCVEHPEKNYTILSNKQIFNQLKLKGPFSKERCEDINKQCAAILNSILTDNPRKPQQLRNYIIDQPNVYQSARRRRLRLFKGFMKKAFVFCPSEEKHAEYRELAAKENNFDAVSEEEFRKLGENFEPPVVSSVEFDSVEYVDTTAEEVEARVTKFRAQAASSKKRSAVEEPIQDEAKQEITMQAPPATLPLSFSSDQKMEMFMPPGIEAPEGGMPDYATAMVNYQAFLLAQQHMFLQSQISMGGEDAIEEQKKQLAELQELAKQQEAITLEKFGGSLTATAPWAEGNDSPSAQPDQPEEVVAQPDQPEEVVAQENGAQPE